MGRFRIYRRLQAVTLLCAAAFLASNPTNIVRNFIIMSLENRRSAVTGPPRERGCFLEIQTLQQQKLETLQSTLTVSITAFRVGNRRRLAKSGRPAHRDPVTIPFQK